MITERGRVSRTPEAVILIASVAIIAAIAALSFTSAEAARIAARERNLSQEIVGANTRLLSALTDAETGQRGYLLTGRENYLVPYNDALATIPRLLEEFEMASASEPAISADLPRIRSLAAAKLAELKSTIELRRAGQEQDALAIVYSDRGRTYMEEVRELCDRIERSTRAHLAQFDAKAEKSSRNLRLATTGGLALLGAFLVVSTVTIFSGMSRRDELFRQAYAGEKLLATTLSAIADGVIATDRYGRITFINPVAVRLTGWSEQEARGAEFEKVFQIVNETTRATVESPVEKVLKHGEPAGLANHTELISKSGNDIPIDDSAAPLKDEHGTVIGAVIVFRDVSARRLADRQLRQANEELQQFVDAAAHDLRSPLNSVSAVSPLLADRFHGELGPTGQELIGYITSGIARMKILVDDLLSFARAGHTDHHTAQPLALERPFEEALNNLKSDIEASRAQIVSGPLPRVVMHEAHALQLFQNLIGNAIRYRGEEAPRIRVGAEKNRQEWVVSVADNGIGIEQQYLKQIFQPFKRLQEEDRAGSGIGLATCEKIVKGYGGRIWAESTPGKGSTFLFTLPDGQPTPVTDA